MFNIDRKFKISCRSSLNLPKHQSENYNQQPHQHRRRQPKSEFLDLNTQNNVQRKIGSDYSMKLSDSLVINPQEKYHQLNGVSNTKMPVTFPGFISSSTENTVEISDIRLSKLKKTTGTSTTSPIPFQHYSSSKYRKFNDLWVRLETVTSK